MMMKYTYLLLVALCDRFAYLEDIVDRNGGHESDITSRISTMREPKLAECYINKFRLD